MHSSPRLLSANSELIVDPHDVDILDVHELEYFAYPWGCSQRYTCCESEGTTTSTIAINTDTIFIVAIHKRESDPLEFAVGKT